MIKKLLENLNFKETSKDIYKKQYPNHNNYEITIDFKKSKIYYRDDNKTTIEKVKDNKIQLGDLTTSNFIIVSSKFSTDCRWMYTNFCAISF